MRAIENGAWNDSMQKRLNELEEQQAARGSMPLRISQPIIIPEPYAVSAASRRG
jgi:hypothetical protein